MNVNDLISMLQDLPGDATVVIDGYEWGLEPLEVVRLTFITPKFVIKSTDNMGGEYDLAGIDTPEKNKKPAVYFPRRDRS